MTKVRIVTINVRGLATGNKFVRFCRVAARWARDGLAHAVCAQEHNLAPSQKGPLERLADSFGLHLVISFSATEGHRGGTFILSDNRTLPHLRTVHTEPSMSRAKYEFNAKELDVASVYAPAGDLSRVDFFSHLKAQLSTHTITGGDWNCVPDVTLDVKGPNALNYKNRGAAQLGKLMAELGLEDYRREQLEDEFEHTRKSPVEGTVATRLDR